MSVIKNQRYDVIEMVTVLEDLSCQSLCLCLSVYDFDFNACVAYFQVGYEVLVILSIFDLIAKEMVQIF